jgi:glutamate N-acetyltransferase / amino-acid N-acetyltransferase
MELKLRVLEGGVTEPKGFRATGVSCGLKDGGYKDLGLLLSDTPCEIACSFTKNKVKAAPVLVDIERAGNSISGVIVNSGNANCLTGKTGEKNALDMAALVEKQLSLKDGSVMVASTGVIGRQLVMDRVLYGIEKVCNLIKTENEYKNFSNAIMTTDKKMKNVSYEFELDGKAVRIGASAKGAGMIKPDMETYPLHATMLVFISTDVSISREMLQEALTETIDLSFNRISVDNDTSTNDSVFLLANGAAGNEKITRDNESFHIFKQVLIKVCQSIGKMMVKDGEGATKLIHIQIKNALTTHDAERIARAIGDSYLVKTAMYGQSPNWGRILAAVGYSGGKFELSKTTLSINGLVIFENGDVNRSNESKAGSEMLSPEINITVDLGIGRKEFFIWASDLTTEYVKINANYLT